MAHTLTADGAAVHIKLNTKMTTRFAELISLPKVPALRLRDGEQQLLGEDLALAEVGQCDNENACASLRTRPPKLVVLVSPSGALTRMQTPERDLTLGGAGQAALWQHAPSGCPMQEVLQPLLRKALLVAKDRPAAERGVDF